MPAFETVDAVELKWKLDDAAGKRFVLLDFFADANCKPCTSPGALKKIEKKYAGAWDLLRLNVDAEDSPPVLEEYRIIGIPTLMLFSPNGTRSKFVEIPDQDGDNVLKWLEKEATQHIQQRSPASTSECG